MPPFLPRCLSHRTVREHLQLGFLPKADDVDISWEILGHECPEAVPIDWKQVEKVGDKNAVLPEEPFSIETVSEEVGKGWIFERAVRG